MKMVGKLGGEKGPLPLLRGFPLFDGTRGAAALPSSRIFESASGNRRAVHAVQEFLDQRFVE